MNKRVNEVEQMNLSKLSIAIIVASGLTGCFDNTSNNNSTPSEPVIIAPVEGEVALSGKAVKGPLAFADVSAYYVDDSAANLQGE